MLVPGEATTLILQGVGGACIAAAAAYFGRHMPVWKVAAVAGGIFIAAQWALPRLQGTST